MALNFNLKDLSFNLNDLSFDNIGNWPYIAKVIACVFVGILIIALAYFFDTESQIESLNKVKRQEVQLRQTFEHKQRQAASLPQYKEQLAKMRDSLGHMLRQLPSRTEVPGLLEDISKSGRTTGLEFKLFDPLEEVQHDFYAELPIQIIVDGDYHQFGDFVSRIAALPRIVTMHDLDIKLGEKNKNAPQTKNKDVSTARHLVMSVIAKTYRYAEDENNNDKNSKKKKNDANRKAKK